MGSLPAAPTPPVTPAWDRAGKPDEPEARRRWWLLREEPRWYRESSVGPWGTGRTAGSRETSRPPKPHPVPRRIREPPGLCPEEPLGAVRLLYRHPTPSSRPVPFGAGPRHRGVSHTSLRRQGGGRGLRKSRTGHRRTFDPRSIGGPNRPWTGPWVPVCSGPPPIPPPGGSGPIQHLNLFLGLS